MCGIVGYIGNKNCVPILIEGLKRLEYRGYDSAGIGIIANGTGDFAKSKGKVSVLEEKINSKNFKSGLGIGHTRWATHGEPNEINAQLIAIITRAGINLSILILCSKVMAK